MTIQHAVLIDVTSIQQYVFGSNKLKENLGGSHLVMEILNSHLRNSVKKVVGLNYEPDLDFYKSDYSGTDGFEVGYIGGGNALLFFDDPTKRDGFIKDWTSTLLIIAPGLTTAIASGEFDRDKFVTDKNKLFNQLRGNKSRHIPQTILPRHGITAECSHTGYSVEIWNDKAPSKDKKDYVSAVAYAKIAAAKESTNMLNKKYLTTYPDYCFTDELDKLGQSHGENNHIAIVHIDGNGMGERFFGCTTLDDLRQLASTVKKTTEGSFQQLIDHIIANFDNIMKELGYTNQQDYLRNNDPADSDDNKLLLPIRPIIIGGDDITFVCDGRLGVYFAKLFIEIFEKQQVSDGKPLTACAGIAITKSKYPFYRGYTLAEQLCQKAKKCRKVNEDDGSYLDFHIAYGGFSGSIDDIRAKYYEGVQGHLVFGPYLLGGNEEYSFDKLEKGIKQLKKLARNKRKELRQVLTMGEEECRRFTLQVEARGEKDNLLVHENYLDNKLFIYKKTPYFDMVELMEFYPENKFPKTPGGIA